MLISEAFTEYCRREISMAGMSTKTRETYENLCKLLINFFGDIDVENIRDEDPVRFFEHLCGWQKMSTVRGNLMAFRKVVKWLKRKNYNVIDPEEIKVPKKTKEEMEYLELYEVETFLEAVSRKTRGYSYVNRLRNIAIVQVLFSSGIRVGELCKLNKNSIKNRQFVTASKGGDPRPCFISQEAEKAIKEYLDARADSNVALFISNQNGRRITTGNVRNIFKNACNQCGLEKVHPHTMRHSLATFLLDRGMDLLDVSKILGHTNLNTTQIYTHIKNPKLRDRYNIIMQRVAI